MVLSLDAVRSGNSRYFCNCGETLRITGDAVYPPRLWLQDCGGVGNHGPTVDWHVAERTLKKAKESCRTANLPGLLYNQSAGHGCG